MSNDDMFDTFPTHLAGAKLTPSQFAIRVVEMVQHSGLAALLDRFRDHGFDDAVRTWVSTGKNLTLMPQDIERVLGPEQINGLAREANVSAREAASEVAALLPQLVDKLTPTGIVPDAETLQRYLDLLKQKIGML